MRIYLRLAEFARAKRGWTLRRLADELAMDYQNIINWNTGRSIPHLSTLIGIARLLRCTIDELIAQETSAKETSSQTFAQTTPDIPICLYPKQDLDPKKPGRPGQKPLDSDQEDASSKIPLRYDENL